ncbi:amidoligase family protein [Heliorestis convoluta]|uniref:amidoligase family protein n=1 Tax=Heliorestis convoluta TaxID=356322 RepID=UPI00242D4702|nr:amidoligase family protein [Heliorestis convoluta]
MILNSRYLKLNIQSYWTHGTLEFRQHGGSLDGEKVTNWIIFSQSIVERSKGTKVRLSHDRDSVDLDKQERRFRRMIFGNYKAGCLDNEYGQAFQYQVERRQHFLSRVA